MAANVWPPAPPITMAGREHFALSAAGAASQPCGSTGASAAGRRFSELLPPPGPTGQRPPSPFAHEAEGTDLRNGKEQQQRRALAIREQSSLGSDGTLSRSLSSPELLQLPLMTSQSTSSGLPALSATPSPLPTNELSLLSPMPTAKCQQLLHSANGQLNYLSSSSSLQSLKAQQSLPLSNNAGKHFRRPKMQLNGTSILSIDISKLTKKASSTSSPMPHTRQRHSSGGSAQSDTKRNLISLTTSVGNAIQRTRRELQRTRLWHAFYAFALPVYTLAGALLFQALDGAHDDRMREEYERRCLDGRDEKMAELERFCTAQAGEECFLRMQQLLAQVETCYRRWHDVNKTITHPMSDFTNAVIYAFSVYTTIGYGTISASSTAARIATVFYGVFGIPLFFAFIKEEGNACRTVFIRLYNWLKCSCRRHMAAATAHLPQPIRKISVSACRSVLSKNRSRCQHRNDKDCESSPLAASPHVAVPVEIDATKSADIRPASVPTTKSTRFSVQPPYVRQCSDFSLPTKGWKQDSSSSSSNGRLRQRVTSDSGTPIEQRRVFLCGVLVFCIYLLTCSLIFSRMTGWDYFTAFYFLFNSVALIGFGDVFPKKPRVILVNMFFIVLGVVLFSMCYFILQEEIRVKAFEASRKARTSIAKYSQSLMLHTRPWSRRNSPAFDKTFEHFDRLRKRRQSAPAIALPGNHHERRAGSSSSRKETPPLKV